jgi:hypothetical protein
MPFEIDTGSDTTGPAFGFGRDVFMDGVLDSLPADAPKFVPVIVELPSRRSSVTDAMAGLDPRLGADPRS